MQAPATDTAGAIEGGLALRQTEDAPPAAIASEDVIIAGKARHLLKKGKRVRRQLQGARIALFTRRCRNGPDAVR